MLMDNEEKICANVLTAIGVNTRNIQKIPSKKMKKGIYKRLVELRLSRPKPDSICILFI